MNIVITGGSTFMPIDKVRGITNIFKGKTACDIAKESIARKHNVCLIGNKQMFSSFTPEDLKNIKSSLLLEHYSTYDSLYDKMRFVIGNNYFRPDVVIHSAAVSDYKVSRVLTSLDDDSNIERTGKISSSNETLYLELKQTEKIIDKIRYPWNFKGVLVKFKLQVGISDKELLDIANKSLEASNADIIVANCLEWAHEKAYVISKNHKTGEHILSIINRRDLAPLLLKTISVALRDRP